MEDLIWGFGQENDTVLKNLVPEVEEWTKNSYKVHKDYWSCIGNLDTIT